MGGGNFKLTSAASAHASANASASVVFSDNSGGATDPVDAMQRMLLNGAAVNHTKTTTTTTTTTTTAAGISGSSLYAGGSSPRKRVDDLPREDLSLRPPFDTRSPLEKYEARNSSRSPVRPPRLEYERADPNSPHRSPVAGRRARVIDAALSPVLPITEGQSSLTQHHTFTKVGKTWEEKAKLREVDAYGQVQVRAAQEEVRRMHARCQHLEERALASEAAGREAQQKISLLETENSTAKKLIQSLQNHLAHYQDKAQMSTLHIETLERANSDVETQVADIVEMKNSAERELEQCQKRVAELEASLSMERTERQALSTKMESVLTEDQKEKLNKSKACIIM
jgi:hypothetical protein